MRVLIATDAWHPQVNGVVRTLTSLAAQRDRPRRRDRVSDAGRLPAVPLPTYPGLRLALPSAARDRAPHRAARPDAIHIATEGPIGHIGARLLPAARAAVHHQLHDAVSRIHRGARARSRNPGATRCCAASMPPRAVTMVSTPSLMNELRRRGFGNLGMWTRGVDTDLFCAGSRDRARSSAPDLPQRRPRRGREEPRSVPLARPARLQGRDRRRAAGGRAAAALPGREVPRPAGGPRARRRIWRRPTCSCSRAGPTRSASCSSRRSPAACRSRPFRSPARRT